MVSGEAGREPAAPEGAGLREARKLIERQYDAPWTLQRLARRVRIPRFAFHSTYQSMYGLSPMDHLRQVRAREAAKLLATGLDPSGVALLVGYGTAQAFAAEYRRAYRNDDAKLKLLNDLLPG